MELLCRRTRDPVLIGRVFNGGPRVVADPRTSAAVPRASADAVVSIALVGGFIPVMLSSLVGD